MVRLEIAVRMCLQHSSTGQSHRYAPLRDALDSRTTISNGPLHCLSRTLPLLPIPCLPSSLWPSLFTSDTPGLRENAGILIRRFDNTDQANQEGRYHRKVRNPLWCFVEEDVSGYPIQNRQKTSRLIDITKPCSTIR